MSCKNILNIDLINLKKMEMIFISLGKRLKPRNPVYLLAPVYSASTFYHSSNRYKNLRKYFYISLHEINT